MNNTENDNIILCFNDLINFITDIDTNVSLKSLFGVCPVELASLIIKDTNTK